MLAEPMPLDRKPLEISQGLAKTFTRKVFDDRGYPILGFSGRERLEAEIWMGDTGAEVPFSNATASWTKPADGEYQIAIPAMSIPKGIYSIRALLDPNGEPCYDDKREVFRGYLKVHPSPSACSSDPLRSYCSYQDLLDKAPWLETTHVDNDLSGFARQRHRARVWIDSAIARNAPNTNWNASNVIFYGVFPPGFTARNRVMSLLNSDKLVITPQLRDAAAHYTLWLICDALSSTPTTGSYGEIALKHKSRANSIMQSMIATFSEDGETVIYSVDMRMANGRSRF
ncbi:hypothetical protein UFOVP142_34 [uncultured Caudovirales phage]|uniref:Uncharacterized protein n=1 Tax=uncultured Caudovirales phage TaxID=2100421 RepID=A0A6J7XL70_9CAUD|nr:hypothetical protein UFOVP142_34 [uncultured Caudovirales phage]